MSEHVRGERILYIDSGVRREGSVSRQLTAELVERLVERSPDASVVYRDLADGIAPIDADWLAAGPIPASERDERQQAALELADRLVAELRDADTVVLGVPVYNFGVPSVLKAWFDQVARARVTFRYTESGPEGLLTGKRAVVVYASGGTAFGSESDFASPWLRHALGFVGLTDIRFVVAERLVFDRDAAFDRARADIESIVAGLPGERAVA